MTYEQFCDQMKRTGQWPLSKRKIFNNAHKAGYREGYLDGYGYSIEEILELQTHVERLRGSMTALIAESESVLGLHLNRDAAPWKELLSGGRFEEWLSAFDETPRQSLAAVRAEAVESVLDHCRSLQNRHICFDGDIEEYAQQLRNGEDDD